MGKLKVGEGTKARMPLIAKLNAKVLTEPNKTVLGRL